MNAGSHLTTVGIDSGSRIWADVGERLEAFAKAWDAGDRFPEIREFLPDDSFPARTLILSELIKLDIERRIQRNIDRPLEDYVRDFPLLADDGPPTDLVYEDFHLRRQAGRPVDLDDYFRRFPRGADDLGRLLNHGPQTQSTSVVSAAPHVQFEPGAQLDDFDLLALLGEGQFARVFLARQRSMQRMVALKVSAARGTEAQTLAQLDHPHIVRVFDQRFLPDHHVQLVYMAYLPGGTLQQVVVQARATSGKERSGQTLLEAVDAALHARGEVPPPASAVRKDWSARSWPAAVCVLGVKLAGALDYAHRQGVLHRDVKPANILLTPEGEPLLADFNIGSCSKLDGAGPSAVFGGSLPYMSPEHLEAFNPAHAREPESLDGRADIFSLAVTLWELLAGERPFTQDLRGSSWTEMLNELVEIRRMGPTVAERASIADGDVPGLREVLLRCLDPDVERRPATAAEMASELGLCLRPATRALVRPNPGGWRAVVRQYPYWTLIVAGVIPNALASIFNIVYNRAEIVRQWGNGNRAEQVFYSIIPLLNGIFFPLGVLTVFLLMRPLASALRQVRLGHALGEEIRDRARRRALRIGEIGALVCVACWSFAGLTWPITLTVAAGSPQQGTEAYVHFLVSLVLCGLIAAAYPYFLITFAAVRVWYPSLLAQSGPVEADQPALRRVGKQLSRFRAAATAVPLVGVALLASRGASAPVAVAVLSVVGLAGTAIAYVLEGWTRHDLAALSPTPPFDGR